MNRIYRRQRQQYLLAAIVGAVALINLLFFLILYRPARSEYFNLRGSVEPLRSEIMSRQVSFAQKEKLSSQLETTDQDRRLLFAAHFIKREAGFAEILSNLDEMEQQSGVRKTRVDYSDPDPIPQYGLYSIKIRIPVQGSYASIVNFLRELERSDKFYIIDAVEVHTGSEGTAITPVAPVSPSGLLSLSMSLETFFYQ